VTLQSKMKQAMLMLFLVLSGMFADVSNANMIAQDSQQTAPTSSQKLFPTENVTARRIIMMLFGVAFLLLFANQFKIQSPILETLYVGVLVVTSLSLVAIVGVQLGLPDPQFQPRVNTYALYALAGVLLLEFVILLIRLKRSSMSPKSIIAWIFSIIAQFVFLSFAALLHALFAIWVKYRLIRSGSIVASKSTESVHAWSGLQAKHPEELEASAIPTQFYSQLGRKNLGIAMAGDGIIAPIFHSGALMVLENNGFMSNVRFISAVSSGAWFSSVYSFHSDDDMLGTYLEPSTLEFEQLATSSGNGNFDAALGTWPNIYETYFGALLDRANSPNNLNPWGEAVARSLLSPFGLADKALNSTLQQADKPFPIFTASIKVDSEYAPFEFTPWYSGVLRHAADHVAGFIETTSFNSAFPANLTVPLDGLINAEPETPFSLADLVGLTSSPLAQKYGDAVDATLSKISNGHIKSDKFEYNYWSPRFGALASDKLEFTDGSFVDGLGVLALLRRKVQAILILYPASTDVTMNTDQNIARLFGLRGEANNLAVDARTQVFEAKHYAELLTGLKDRKNHTQSYVFSQRCNVLSNDYAGVVGDFTVDLMWVINAQIPTFEALLPSSTKSALNAQRAQDGILGPEMKIENFLDHNLILTSQFISGFPYVPAVCMTSPEMVTLLKQQTAWVVNEAQDSLQLLLSP